MQWASMIVAAPRQSPVSLRECFKSLRANGLNPMISAEPGTDLSVITEECRVFQRDKKLGNFHHWIAAAKTLLATDPTADYYLMSEDDALYNIHTVAFVNQMLRPEHLGGVFSLYCANIAQFRNSRARIFRSTRENHVGSLAMLFDNSTLTNLVNSQSINEWKGSHDQRRIQVAASELKAVDTWMGNEIFRMQKPLWIFSRSLVAHFMPADAPQNSALGHGDASRSRSAYGFVGAFADPWKVYRMPRQ